MVRDMGGGFKASYTVRQDGWYEVAFFRYGRKVSGNVFRPNREDEALRVFTGTSREDLVRSLKVVL